MGHDGIRLVFEGHQGRVLGRRGVVHVEVQIEDAEPLVVTIPSDAVIRARANSRDANRSATGNDQAIAD
jgi:hypothetical protein